MNYWNKCCCFVDFDSKEQFFNFVTSIFHCITARRWSSNRCVLSSLKTFFQSQDIATIIGRNRMTTMVLRLSRIDITVAFTALDIHWKLEHWQHSFSCN